MPQDALDDGRLVNEGDQAKAPPEPLDDSHPSTLLGMALSLSPFDQAHGDPEVLEGSKGHRAAAAVPHPGHPSGVAMVPKHRADEDADHPSTPLGMALSIVAVRPGSRRP
jgi:hypothetical protein